MPCAWLSRHRKRGSSYEIIPTVRNLDEFRRQVQELHAELSRLQQVLQHESTYSLDELIDLLSRMFSDHPAAYRRIPPLE
jgi:hypothetical protein